MKGAKVRNIPNFAPIYSNPINLIHMNRKTLTTALVSLLLLVGCGERQQRNELITINASANYPEKELVAQDFMDVEYVPLETTDDYLTQGDVQAIGNQYIVVKNWVNDGDIFLVKEHPRGYELRFVVRTSGKALGIYRGPARLDENFGRYEYWVGWATGRERLTAYAFDLSDLVSGTRMATRIDRGKTALFRLAMGARRVAFQELACYYLMEEIYNLL